MTRPNASRTDDGSSSLDAPGVPRHQGSQSSNTASDQDTEQMRSALHEFLLGSPHEDVRTAFEHFQEEAREAETLSHLIRSCGSNQFKALQTIQKHLLTHPIGAAALLTLVSIEREKNASSLESAFRLKRTEAARSARKKSASDSRSKTQEAIVAASERHRRLRSKRNATAIIKRELEQQGIKASETTIRRTLTTAFPGKTWNE